MEEKYNQLEDENASDTSEKSKTGLATPEKKILVEPPPKVVESLALPSTASASSTGKTEPKEEEEQDSDHEDPHGT